MKDMAARQMQLEAWVRREASCVPRKGNRAGVAAISITGVSTGWTFSPVIC